jgi:transcription antitermination factor NusG
MSEFEKGDKVRVRLDTASPYRGRIGIVDKETEDSSRFWYVVKFESKGFSRSYSVAEIDLEKINQ